ncbi:hypothetical protein [Microbacterium terricola]|uniref:Transcriptional regulator, AbiEi antitoxin, Type IV TA system n=1 Tax=Microbacterium terricola TaxID=344163 RepID=A0ABM8DWW0_9MICO|nr:hypothetical protein [Microbacterium terricola]UYK39184.1 hypothetical protein OAU46_10805 [Microbacterium terricola]BDV30097.1 hypothetical protein Microterr_07570 [Microbacterium terricola]
MATPLHAHADAEIRVVRRREREGIDDRRLRRQLESGSVVRVWPGAFVSGPDWRRLSPMDQHRVRVEEAIRRARGAVVSSHFAAAAHHRIDILGGWPSRVDVSRSPASGGRSSGLIRRHAREIERLSLEPLWGDHQITTATQTALDLARILPFTNGVAVIDQAIWIDRPGGALTTRDEILQLLDSGPPHRGDARARRAIAFAQPLAANVRESQSRVLIAQLGFPAPRLQEHRVLRSGRVVYGDFYFPAHDHWAELDGRGKYRSPEFGHHRDPAEIVIDEKNRENEIRREVRGFSRWEPSDLTARRLYDILTGDGLPSRLPRP